MTAMIRGASLHRPVHRHPDRLIGIQMIQPRSRRSSKTVRPPHPHRPSLHIVHDDVWERLITVTWTVGRLPGVIV
jgi:hypothetical protein